MSVLDPKRVFDTALCALYWIGWFSLFCYYPIYTLGIAISVIVITWVYSVWRWSFNSGRG